MLLRLTKHWQFTSKLCQLSISCIKSPDSWGSVSFVDKFLFGQTWLNCLVNLNHELCIDDQGVKWENEKSDLLSLAESAYNFWKFSIATNMHCKIPSFTGEICWFVLLSFWLDSLGWTVLLILYLTQFFEHSNFTMLRSISTCKTWLFTGNIFACLGKAMQNQEDNSSQK